MCIENDISIISGNSVGTSGAAVRGCRVTGNSGMLYSVALYQVSFDLISLSIHIVLTQIMLTILHVIIS